VEGNLQTDSSEVIRTSVLAGMGIGYAPTWLFEAEIASGEVQRLLPAWSVPSPSTSSARRNEGIRPRSGLSSSMWQKGSVGGKSA
jgi:DNA-binding transcriptional LysR family regulator